MPTFDSFSDRVFDRQCRIGITYAEVFDMYTEWMQEAHPALIGAHAAIFAYAWDKGHAYGAGEVAIHVDDLMDVIEQVATHLTKRADLKHT